MKRWQKLLLFVGLLCAAIVWFVAWSGDGFFGGTEVCTTCGRMNATSRTFWIPTSKIKDTEISQFYDGYKGDDHHSHTWLFASGGGGAITCAIGRGRHLYSAVSRAEVRHALQLIRANEDDAQVDLWLGRLLDPKLSRDAWSALTILAERSVPFDVSYREAQEMFEMNYPTANKTTSREQNGGGQPATPSESK